MSKRNNFIWKGIQVICWLIFFGYCIQTGALIFNYVFSLFKPIATHNLHLGLDLSELYLKSKPIYTLVFALIVAVSALKAYLFFVVLKLFKTLNLTKPFSENVSGIIKKITYYTLSIGIIHRFKKIAMIYNLQFIYQKPYHVSDISTDRCV